MTFSERMLKIDRRIIFLVIGFCTLLPLLYPVGLPIKISPEVRSIYDYMPARSRPRVTPCVAAHRSVAQPPKGQPIRMAQKGAEA